MTLELKMEEEREEVQEEQEGIHGMMENTSSESEEEEEEKEKESEEKIDVKMDDTSEGEGEGETENVEIKGKITRSKDKEHRHFGNFRHYYERRNKDLPEDLRLKLLRKEWFEGKDILDIGCNCGKLTITIAQRFMCRSIHAIDIDHDLVKKAKKKLKEIVKEAKKIVKEEKNPGESSSSVKERDHAKDDSSEQNVEAVSSNEEKIPRELSSLEKSKLRRIVKFQQENFITSDLLQEEAYDTILCLSITQWIHLNWGDRGIITLFAKIWQLLRLGGVLVLEPQPWRCYVNKHDISIVTNENYNKIQLFPEQFQEILLDKIGFRTVEHLNPSWLGSKIRFNRPILVFKK